MVSTGRAVLSSLEIQPATDDKPSFSGRRNDSSEGDVSTGWTGRRAGSRAVDVRIGKVEIRMVQHLDGIDPEFELFRLGDPNALDQVGVEAQERRTLNGIAAETADLTRHGIHKKKASLGVGNRLIAERKNLKMPCRASGVST